MCVNQRNRHFFGTFRCFTHMQRLPEKAIRPRKHAETPASGVSAMVWMNWKFILFGCRNAIIYSLTST